uniref:CCHC-type domain-containing protein n=1 Tax=Trichogramma kaykai TaxID=54128 RepID=A0ABD2WYZ9_9HYME
MSRVDLMPIPAVKRELAARGLTAEGTGLELQSRLARSEVRLLFPEVTVLWQITEDENPGSATPPLTGNRLVPDLGLLPEQQGQNTPDGVEEEFENEAAGEAKHPTVGMTIPTGAPNVVTTTQSSTGMATSIAYSAPVTTSGGFNSAPRLVFTSTTASEMANFGALAFSSPFRYQSPGPITSYPPRPAQHTQWNLNTSQYCGTLPKTINPGKEKPCKKNQSVEKNEREVDRRDKADSRGKSEHENSAKEKPRRITKSSQWRAKKDNSESDSQSDPDQSPCSSPGGQRRRRRARTPEDRTESDQSEEEESRDRQSRRRSGQNSSLTAWQTSKILQGWQISFDGENREEARAFLASLKECQESNEIPTDRLLGSMPVVLKDKAKRWYRENKHRWTTWASFRKAFENKYMKLLRDSEVRRDLDRRTQAKGETISDFADCFRYLVRHLRRKPEETELVEMFLRNVRSEYRRHIVAARPWTIDEAVELGQELEQMLEDDERFEEPSPKSKMNLADAGVQTKKTVKIAAIEEVANSSDSDGPQKGNKTPAKKQTAKQQQKVPQSNKTKAEKATKTSKAKDSAEETPNSEPVTSYELSPNPWHYPTYDEWQAHAMSAMQYAPAVAMPTMPPRPTWPPRPMYQAPWPPASPEQGRGQMAWNNLVRPPVQASTNAGNDSPGIDRPKGKFSGPCFNCQTPGYRAANCPHKICTICKQNGHGQNACPNKPIAPPPNAGSKRAPRSVRCAAKPVSQS